MREVVKGRAPDSMDTLVTQTKSPFTAEVLHFPLPVKFKMPQIETFDGTKDPVDHLNTYKNQMDMNIRSPTAQFEELDYSTQAMHPKSQFSSGILAHKALAPKSPATQLKSSTTQLRPCSPKSQFSSRSSADKASSPRSLAA